MRRMNLPTLAIAGILTFAGAFQAKASYYVIDLRQVGNNVVATGSGNIDTTGLDVYTDYDSAGMDPGIGYISVGPTASTKDDTYYYFGGSGPVVLGPTSFGPAGPEVDADAGSGNIGLISSGEYISVPHRYVSGNPLLGTATWYNATFASLNITPGTYTWTWDGGADTFTLNAIAPVPEPSQYGLGIVLALAGLFAVRRIRAA